MSVIGRLRRIDEVLQKLIKLKNKVDLNELVGYDEYALSTARLSLGRAITRYERDSTRVKKYLKSHSS
jgi:hypothetical protein